MEERGCYNMTENEWISKIKGCRRAAFPKVNS